LGHGCGYYVLLEGGREDQLTGAEGDFCKTSQGEEKEKKKKEKIARTVKGDLEKYSRERNARQEREGERERDGLGGEPRPKPGQVTHTKGLSRRSRSKSE